MDAGTVVITAERVADKDGVVAGRVEGPVGLVAEGEARQRDPAIEGERLRGDKVLPRHQTDFARAVMDGF